MNFKTLTTAPLAAVLLFGGQVQAKGSPEPDGIARTLARGQKLSSCSGKDTPIWTAIEMVRLAKGSGNQNGGSAGFAEPLGWGR